MALTFRRSSTVPTTPSKIWQVVTSPEGINYELMPVMKMTVPAGLKGKVIQELPLNQRIGRSWFLLLGFIPIDFDDITIAEREEGRRFLEKSTMLSMSAWEHERTIVDYDGGSQVTDRVTFQLRPPLGWLPGAHALIGTVLQWLFAHRHRRLGQWFREADQKARAFRDGQVQPPQGAESSQAAAMFPRLLPRRSREVGPLFEAQKVQPVNQNGKPGARSS